MNVESIGGSKYEKDKKLYARLAFIKPMKKSNRCYKNGMNVARFDLGSLSYDYCEKMIAKSS